MAIVITGTTGCSLCGATLAETDDIVMFPHFIWDEDDPLWRYSDSGMHRACFSGWDQADQFRAFYNRVWPEIVPNHPRAMQPDGTIIDLRDGRTT